MSIIVDETTSIVAERVRAEREARGWTIAELAQRSGVSKAMISKLERVEASPTAMLLGRLAGAFGLTLSTLLARAETAGRRLARRTEQQRWRDPETGYVRQAVSPAAGGPLDLVRVELPARTRVTYPRFTYAFLHQQIWVLEGTLVFREGDVEHQLEAGDCLQLGAPSDCTFANPADRPCQYLVAVVRG
jgi:transcriptional regulator with XRE-family HTH domain